MRSIGVSNFSIKNLEILLKKATVVPANNQVEVNPCLPQFELQKYCEERGILLTAYSPLGAVGAIYAIRYILMDDGIQARAIRSSLTIQISSGLRRNTASPLRKYR